MGESGDYDRGTSRGSLRQGLDTQHNRFAVRSPSLLHRSSIRYHSWPDKTVEITSINVATEILRARSTHQSLSNLAVRPEFEKESWKIERLFDLVTMFGPDCRPLPTELLLQVFSQESFKLSDYRRFARVNKEWRSVTYSVNRFRKLRFLPPVDKQGSPPTSNSKALDSSSDDCT
jgi:hypothetical protein